MPTKTDIETELRRIGKLLTFPCEWTHFGGCSMAMQGIKDATKDVDVVMQPVDKFRQLVNDLDHDYSWLENEAAKQYQRPEFVDRLNEWQILQGPLSIDVFPPGRIFNVLTYSPEMLIRRIPHLKETNLTTYLADPSTTFLLKSITGRWRKTPGRDIDDMQSILDRHGVDWFFVTDEWKRQMTSCPDPARATELAREAVAQVRRSGYKVNWDP